MQKDGLISALHMVEVGVAVMKAAGELPEGNLGYASGMVAEKDAKRRTAQKAQKASLVSVFLMEVAVDVNILNAQKGLKEAQCFARHMGVVNDVLLKDVTKVLKGARLSARVMVEGKGVHSKEVGFVQKVCMEAPFSVWHMVVVRGVLFQNALRVRGGGLIFVYVMEGARDANLKGVEKVLREALISARPTVVGRGAHGGSLLLNLEMVKVLATRLCVGRLGCVLLMVLWFRINGFMVLQR